MIELPDMGRSDQESFRSSSLVLWEPAFHQELGAWIVMTWLLVGYALVLLVGAAAFVVLLNHLVSYLGPRGVLVGLSLLVVGLGAALLVPIFSPVKLVAGREGVSISWLLYHRFIPFGSMTAVELAKDPVHVRIRLVLRGNGCVEVPVRMRAREFPEDEDAQHEELAESVSLQISRRMQAAHAAPRAEVDVRCLRRDGRFVEQWSADLSTLEQAGAPYREHPISVTGLWRVVEDGTLDLEVRIGAVMALLPSLDDDGKRRLKNVAESSARVGFGELVLSLLRDPASLPRAVASCK